METQVFVFDAEGKLLTPSMMDNLIFVMRHSDVLPPDDWTVRWPEAQQSVYTKQGFQIVNGKFHNGMACRIDPTLPDNEVIIETSGAVGAIRQLAVERE